MTLNEIDVTRLLNKLVLAVKDHRVDSGLGTHLPRTLWPGFGSEHPLLVDSLGTTFRGDEVVVIVFAIDMGPLGDSDSDGRLPEKFRECQ